MKKVKSLGRQKTFEEHPILNQALYFTTLGLTENFIVAHTTEHIFSL